MGKFRMPSAYTVLFLIILLMTALTWVIPSGAYDYGPDGEPIAGSYHRVENEKQPLSAVVMAPLEGLYEAIDIAAFILMVGGFLGVVSKTGAIDAGISNIIRKLRGREKLLIPILMCAFALGGTTFGMAEETIAFYPLVLPIVVAAGYDTVTGVAIILLGAGVGVIGSTVNPFATGIAAGFAGVTLGEGMLLRVAMLLLLLALAVWFVMAYAQRVKDDPARSVVADRRSEHLTHFGTLRQEERQLTATQKLALTLFSVTFLVMVYAVIPFDDMGLPLHALGWWFPQLSALFLAAAVITGLACRLGEENIISAFISGAAELLGVAFIIGISRGITVIMNNGKITDTILSWGESALSGAGPLTFTALVYLIYFPLSFLIPSTSGLATLSMPVMAPLADFAGVGRDVIITAFQSACGLVNLLTPTSAVVMGALAIGRISYDRWLKFAWKYLVMAFVLILALLCLAVLM